MGRKCVWIGVAFLAVFCGAFGSQEECAEGRATECQGMLLDLLSSEFTEEEACEKLYAVSKCLRNVVRDCLGDEEHPEVEKSLRELESVLDKNCAATSEGDTGDEDEVDKCLEENQDYLLECIFDKESGEISKLLQPESVPAGMDPEFVQCYLFGLMAHCIVGHSEEKCGVAGAERAADKLSDMPPSVQESCESQEDSVEDSVQELFSVNLLEQRKKRGLVDYRKKRQVDYRKKRQLEYRKKRAPQDWLPMTFAGVIWRVGRGPQNCCPICQALRNNPATLSKIAWKTVQEFFSITLLDQRKKSDQFFFPNNR